MRVPNIRTLAFGIATLIAAPAVPAIAHHGWGFYNTDRPMLFSGRLVEVNYANPHPEVTIEIAEGATLDPTSLPVPDELAALGFANVVANARPAPVGRWTLDLAPISRLNRWGMPREPKIGDVVQAVGFPSCEERNVARPNLIVLDGVGVRQQSVRLPAGCSGEPRG
jgi:hypothetical protein